MRKKCFLLFMLALAATTLLRAETGAYATLSLGRLTLTYGELPKSGSYYAITNGGSKFGWEAVKGQVSIVNIDPSFADYKPTTTSGWFKGMANAVVITGLSNINAANLQSMNSMFAGCAKLAQVNLRGFYGQRTVGGVMVPDPIPGMRTPQLTSTDSMFAGCAKLKHVDVSGLSTNKVTSMKDMFNGCASIVALDLSDFSFMQNCTLTRLLSGCTGLRALNMGSNDLSVSGRQILGTRVDIFKGVGTASAPCAIITSGEFKTSELGRYTIDISSGVGSYHWHSGYFNVQVPLAKYDVAAKTLTFSLGKATDKTNFARHNDGYRTSGVVNPSQIVWSANGTAATTGAISALPGYSWHSQSKLYIATDVVEVVKDPAHGLHGYDTIYDPAGEVVSKQLAKVVIDDAFWAIRPADISSWFSNMTQITAINGLSNLNTADLICVKNLFAGDLALESVDLNGFKTARVTDMSGMFSDCAALSAVDVSGFRTHSATSMSAMFNGCSSLAAMDLSNFSTSNVTSVSDMFNGCTSLSELNLGVNDFSHIATNEKANTFSGVGTPENPCSLEVDLAADQPFDLSELGMVLTSVNGDLYYHWLEGFFTRGATTGIGEVKASVQHDPNAPAFNLNGQRVASDYRGIVIQNGQKILRR